MGVKFGATTNVQVSQFDEDGVDSSLDLWLRPWAACLRPATHLPFGVDVHVEVGDDTIGVRGGRGGQLRLRNVERFVGVPHGLVGLIESVLFAPRLLLGRQLPAREREREREREAAELNIQV